MAFGPSSDQASDSCLPLGSVAVIASASALLSSPLIPRNARSVFFKCGSAWLIVAIMRSFKSAIRRICSRRCGQASGQFRRVELQLLRLPDRSLKIPARHAALDRRHRLGERRVELTLFEQLG